MLIHIVVAALVGSPIALPKTSASMRPAPAYAFAARGAQQDPGATDKKNKDKKPELIAGFMAGNIPPPTPVSTAKATAESVPQSLEAIGTLMAVHQVTVSPQVDGKVLALKFESGDAVKQGDVLVQAC